MDEKLLTFLRENLRIEISVRDEGIPYSDGDVRVEMKVSICLGDDVISTAEDFFCYRECQHRD